MRCVIGIDVGTSGLKAVLCDENGQVLATASEKYPVEYPNPGWAEQDPEYWEKAFIRVVPVLLSKGKIKQDDVEGICLSSQIDGVVLVDDNGNPISKAIIWMDRRATKEQTFIEERIGKRRLYSITGMVPDPAHPAAKILWLKNNYENIYKKAWKILQPNDFMINYLTSEAVTDYSNASCTMLFDIRRKKWNDEICEELGIPIEKLPDIRPSTSIAGNLRKEIAEKVNLRPGIPVVVGGGDEEIGAVGAGAIDEGTVLDIIGTAEPVVMSVNEPKFDEMMVVECHCHGHPDKWLLENPGILSGGIYSWLLETFLEYERRLSENEGRNPYELMNSKAEKVNIGCDGLICLPYFMGTVVPEWNPDAKGAFVGITPYHKKEHFIRAVIEGTGFAVRDTIERFSSIGIPGSSLIVAGGGSKGVIWRKIRADITGLITKSPVIKDVTAYGAALIALVGIGMYKTVEDVVKLIKYEASIAPDPMSHEQYLELYKLYRELYCCLKEKFSRIRV